MLGRERYVPALGEQTWWSSPTQIAKDDEAEVVLMTQVECDILGSTTATDDEEETMFRLAGRFARRLHDLRLSVSDNTAPSMPFRDCLEHYLAAGRESIDGHTVDWTRGPIDRACSEGSVRSVPCHRDLPPRNWLLHRSPSGIRFGVIDWERGGSDLWLQDVQRMAYDHWQHKPWLREAYFEGYGREPTEVERLQLDAICLVGAIASISWADRHNDPNFAAVSREVIERVRLKY